MEAVVREEIVATGVREAIKEGKRWSGADWSDMQQEIMVVGQGGIGSWLSLCLASIEHTLYLIDMDRVDETNVQGGQMYRTGDIGMYKSEAVHSICREFGVTSRLNSCPFEFTEQIGSMPITVTGLDNMKARKLVFKTWIKNLNSSEDKEKFLLIDGRLNLEDYEIICIQGNKPEQIAKYEREYLFDDDEVADVDCTAKQTRYTAMGIASFMTAILCNWLTNKKLDAQARDVPFHTRIYYPAMLLNVNEVKIKEELV